jgi:thiol-disulfide isomerase/thioredoxin
MTLHSALANFFRLVLVNGWQLVNGPARFPQPVFFRVNIGRLRRMSLVGLALAVLWMSSTTVARAGLNDDHYDGNIFPLYAGNGSLVPPKVSLAEALRRDKPTFLIFYLDDSRDCKAYSSVVSQLDAFYGRAADFIPVNIDAIPPRPTYTPQEPGFYYSGLVPQVVLLDQSGAVVLDEVGQVPFEKIDDEFRVLFDLLPRSESVELKRRQVNEINVELQPDTQSEN